LRVWDAATGEDVFVLQGHAPAAYAVCFSPDSAWLASAGATADGAGEIRLWDARTGREEWTVQGAVSGPVRCLAFSPNGDRIASGAEGSGDVKLWDARTGLAAVSLPGHKGGVRFVSFSPEGDRLVSIGDDHTVRVWDAKEVEQSN
jgi:WD40 repeat protein